MKACKTLIHSSLCLSPRPSLPKSSPLSIHFPPISQSLGICLYRIRTTTRLYSSTQGAVSVDFADNNETSQNDTVEHLLNNRDDVSRLMKMERRNSFLNDPVLTQHEQQRRWFPYLDKFKCMSGSVGGGGCVYLSSGEVLEAVGPYIMEERKARFRSVVKNRSYSVCLVVEGLSDFGNVSAAFRSADALGFQSVHVVSCDSSKRCIVG